MASPFFKSMLKDIWIKESPRDENGKLEIEITICESDSLLIILNAIHGKSRKLPLKLTLRELVSVAVAADYFQCNEAMEPFASKWIYGILKTEETQFGPRFLGLDDEIPGLIMIASAFQITEVLSIMTNTAIRKGEGPFDTKSLPIPGEIKAYIDERREEYIKGALQSIETHIINLLTGLPVCDGVCQVTYVGLIQHQLARFGIYLRLAATPPPRDLPYTPIEGISVDTLNFAMRDLPPVDECPREAEIQKEYYGSERWAAWQRHICANKRRVWGQEHDDLMIGVDEWLSGMDLSYWLRRRNEPSGW